MFPAICSKQFSKVNSLFVKSNKPNNFFVKFIPKTLLFSCSNFATMSTDPHSIFQYSVLDEFGNTVCMDKYKGKVVIIVNVASNCGYTKPNYTGLKLLSDKYKSQGFEVACFPCNQFKQQEPGTEAEIHKFIKENFNFEPDLYKKIDVNGEQESPLFTFLKKEQGDSVVDALKTLSLPSSDIKWNFTKFVCDQQGHPISRYPPAANPSEMTSDIEKCLMQ